ncbi:MAG: hypothetical protein JXJ17_02775 [Anaerolineae bacterium]|nr:hypothetical protein [Anaerolineae bacterium]
MRKSSGLFWGVLILLVGGLLLLRNLGFIAINVWGMVWPLMLILAGVWVLFGMRGMWGVASEKAEYISVPLEGAERAHVHIEHGIGMATLSGVVEGGDLMSGSFGAGLNYSTRLRDGVQHLRMKMADPGFPWWHQSFNWDFRLNGSIPMTIRLQGGAGMLNFNMHDLRVTELRYDAGVGTASVTLPAHAGLTTATVKAGVGTLTLIIPQGVAARIRVQPGLGSISVPRERFNREGDTYRSPDYDTAENKIDLRIDGGVGAVTVR